MSDNFDPYVVLGVLRTASLEDIELAYKRAAMQAHPDRPGGSTAAMTDVNMAFKILSDPEMRARFDRGERSTQLPPLDQRAQSLIVSLLMIALRNSQPSDDLIFLLRMQLIKQRDSLLQTRAQALRQIEALRVRLTRLRGPEKNFIEGAILNEIQKGEYSLPLIDSDESVQQRALEMLKDFSYGVQVQVPYAALRNILTLPAD